MMITGSGLLYTILVGLVIGLIAAAIMGGGMGWIMAILLGIVGSFVGSIVFNALGMASYGLMGQVIVGVIGACLVLFVAGLVRGRSV